MFPIIIPEGTFVDVAMQMMQVNYRVGVLDDPPQQALEVLHAVPVDITEDVHLSIVNDFMLVETARTLI